MSNRQSIDKLNVGVVVGVVIGFIVGLLVNSSAFIPVVIGFGIGALSCLNRKKQISIMPSRRQNRHDT